MPMIRFTKLIDKVLNHEKEQTIRLPRKIPENWKEKKDPLKIGDTLHVYVLMKVGTARITDIKRKKLKDITDQEMLDDGFDDPGKGRKLIAEMHELKSMEQEFDIITYFPKWPKQKIVQECVICKEYFPAEQIKKLYTISEDRPDTVCPSCYRRNFREEGDWAVIK